MKIAIGSDHAGFEMKEQVKAYLKSEGISVKDFGTNSLESVDYPDFAHPTAKSVESQESDLGILFCGSGNGVAMAANKHKKIRAAISWKPVLAKLGREHNNANILVIPARFIDPDDLIFTVKTFLRTNFQGGRHERRAKKIEI